MNAKNTTEREAAMRLDWVRDGLRRRDMMGNFCRRTKLSEAFIREEKKVDVSRRRGDSPSRGLSHDITRQK